MEREGERASASFSGQSSCTLTHSASRNRLHQRKREKRERREEGGTAQRALALPWTDTHLTYTHTYTLLHRVPVCVPLHSPGCQNLAVSRQGKKQKLKNNIRFNKQTNGQKRGTTHTFGSHWQELKNETRNETQVIKRASGTRFYRKHFLNDWLLNSSTLFLLVYQVYTINLTRQLKSIQYCHFSYIYRYLYTIQSWQKYINKYIKLDCTHHNCVS